MERRIERLLRSDQAYIAYNAALLMGDPKASALKRDMLRDPRVRSLIDELKDWPGPVLSSHKSASQQFHKIAFLADIGVTLEDEGMAEIVARIIANRDERGIPRLSMAISEGHGGSGQQTGAWALCDAPTILYSLIKMGHSDDRVDEAVQAIASMRADDGWGCVVSKELGDWRGPGKKSDPCPYATLIVTKLLLEYDGRKYAKEIGDGAACLLSLWESSRQRHPYIFYMGDDFRKLKLPLIWYDIMHLVSVLSRVPGIDRDGRYREMLETIGRKEMEGGGFIPESVYQPYRAWDFGQKKLASEGLSLFVERIRR